MTDQFLKALREDAVSHGWVMTLQQSPQLVFRPPMTRLITAIREIIIEQVAHRHHFEQWIFPRLIPEEVLSKTGWLNNHREEAWLVDPRRAFEYQPDDSALFPKMQQFPSKLLPFALDPVQCVSLYYAHYGKELSSETDLPLRVFEYQGGWSFRHEAEPDGLIRGIEFLRLEFAWIAVKDQAVSIRNELLHDVAAVLNEDLDLEILVAKGDSCFNEPSPADYAIQDVRELSALESFYLERSVDLLCLLKGDQGKLEVVSTGRDDKLCRRFNIKVKNADRSFEDAWSGCLGVGLTRVAAAFLFQHGFDEKKWPANSSLKRKYRELAQRSNV